MTTTFPAPSATDQVAAVVRAPRSLAFEEAPTPAPGPRQVVVRLEGCGVCGSDVPVWQGRSWFEYPLDAGAPGHEGWGAIEAAGAEVTNVAVGQRVAAIGYHSYARYDVCHAGSVVALPDDIIGPFPGEAAGCALNVFARSGIRSGDTVAVVGVGFIGALLVQLAVAAEARVIALSHRRFALDLARTCGATDSFASDGDAAARVAELTSGAMCDVVMEAAGHQATLDLASALVKERGRLIIAGYHQDGPRRVDMQSWNWRGIDVINAHERQVARYVDGIREAISAVVAGRIDLEPLITHQFPLHELGAALDAATDRPDGFLKAVVAA